jgi:hypothetical protein
MSTTKQQQDGEPQRDNLLDREIRAAMKLGIHEPHADFTRELMSVIAEEEAASVVVRAMDPARLSLTLVALGVVFLVVAIVVPVSSDATSSMSWVGSSFWTLVALALISLLAMTQSKPRYNS